MCNHISFLDPLILGGRIRRPVRFVMYYKIYDTPVMKHIFKAAKAIPIAGHSENEALKEQAFKEIREALVEGHLVCIFPEGGLSPDGKIASFKSGIERILAESSVPVVPMVLHNLWGSLFSRYDKKMIDRRPRKFMAKVDLVVGELIAANQADSKMLYEQVKLLKQSVE
ncbi:MAG: 1-acyl-sn-glycerol-3-phosphate acyltransferase [Proteobacteria bacterium]|nr:1-acyl-sn-glycerol-3-phosphate acyltransferase [Pseudomonadota bacterium]